MRRREFVEAGALLIVSGFSLPSCAPSPKGFGAPEAKEPSSETRGLPMLPLRSELLFTLTGRVSPTVDVGVSPLGHRRIIPVEGGEFEGPKLRGRVLKGGADSMLIDSEGVAHVDVRMVLQTDDGEAIYMQYGGRRHGPPAVMARLEHGEPVDPSEYYFRIVPFFETSSKKYAWLNRIVTVGVGHKLAEGPVYYVHEIL